MGQFDNGGNSDGGHYNQKYPVFKQSVEGAIQH
jgi:hypothetical protein